FYQFGVNENRPGDPFVAPVGGTFTLTTGVDTIVGTAGNDTINAAWNTVATKTLGGLDTVDGGAGIDTMNVDDSATATTVAFTLGGATIKNVQHVDISTSGTLAALNLSGVTGATSFNLKSQDAGALAHSVTVANTADVAV